MIKNFKENILLRLSFFVAIIVHILTMLPEWVVNDGVTSKYGFVLISGEFVFSSIILGIYVFSLILFPLCKKIFFVTGLGSLLIFFVAEIFTLVHYVKELASNPTFFAYLSLATMAVIIITFAVFFGKKAFKVCEKTE